MGEYSSRYEQIRKKNLGESATTSGGSSSSSSSSGKYGSAYEKIKNSHVMRADVDPTITIDGNYISKFFDDYNRFVSSASSSYKGIGYRNANSLYTDYSKQGEDLRRRGDAIKQYLWANRETFGDEYDSLADSIEQMMAGQRSIVDSYRTTANNMRLFDSEDAYNQYVQRQQDYQDKWGHYTGAADYEHYSAKGAAIKNPTMSEAERGITIFGKQIGGADVGNIVTYSRDNYQQIGMGEANGSTVVGKSLYHYMTDEEVGIYNYLLAKEGAESAQAYLDDIEEELNFRMGTGQAKAIMDLDNPVARAAAIAATSVGSGVDQWGSGVRQFFSDEKLPTTAAQYGSSMIAENLDGVGRYAYLAGNTLGNQAPSILVSMLTSGLGAPAAVAQGAGALTMGASAAGNAYGQALASGYGQEQSRAYSLLVGAAEGTLQYLLGGIASLGGISGKVAGKVAAIDNALLRVAAKMGVSIGSEVMEEELQNFLEPAFRSIIFGEEYDAPTIEELIETAIVTALSTGLLESPGNIGGDIANSRYYKTTYGDVQQNLVAQGLESAEGSLSRTLAQEYQKSLDEGSSLSGHQLGRLVEANEQQFHTEDVTAIQSAAANRLTELGETGDVESISMALAKQVAGEKLTRAEQKTISGSMYGQRVANELNPANVQSGEFSSTWARRIGTKSINAEAYNADLMALAEETAGVTASKGGVAAPSKAGEETATSVGSLTPQTEAPVTARSTASQTAEDVSFRSEDEAMVYSAVLDMGVSPAVAQSIAKNFDGTDSRVYVADVKLAYQYGKMNFPKSYLERLDIKPHQAEHAYNLGRSDAKAEVIQPKTRRTIKGKRGKLTFETAVDESTLTDIQRESLNGIKALAELSGIHFHVFESTKTADGYKFSLPDGTVTGANGWYVTGTNDIYIDLNAGNAGEGTMLYTAAHEISHYIKEWSPEKWRVLADFLLEQYGEDVPLEALLERQMAKIRRRPNAPTGNALMDLAHEELVADAMSEMLVDGEVAQKLAELKQKDKTLWEKIRDVIRDLLERWGLIRKEYEGRDVAGEAQFLRGMDEAFRKLQQLYTEAFVEADANYAGQTLGQAGIAVNAKTDSGSLFSVRDVLTEADRKKVAKALVDRFGVTEAEAMEWLKAETSLASLILNPKYSMYLDYEGDPNEVAIKQNSDYPQGTVDFSNICKKRREFTQVMNRVLRNFPNHVFAATDLAKIRTIMGQEGMTLPCGICYVEDRRQLDSIVAQDFIDGLKLYREGSKTRPDGKPFNANQLKGLQMTDGDTYVPTIYELITLEGRNSLKAKNPNMEAAWVRYNNARGMQSVRLLTNEAEYKRQILKYSPKTVQSKNDHGGLRIYSFSDAEMFHLIDIVQVITDSAAVGLKIQGYTKVNEYARAVRDTGEKLNRSLIPAGDLGYHMEGDKVVLDYDTVEGIDIHHEDFFDSKDNPNIGNIVIGINETQIRAAMASDFVDMIIPFHTGQSAEVLGEKGIAAWQNYKDYQSEVDIATGKKSAHQINIYTEVIQAAEQEGNPIQNKRQFVEKFLAVCKQHGLKPRFAQFLNTDANGDYVYTEGYHKFLVDFKTFAQTEVGEYLPQMPVKPIFDNAYITGLLRAYVTEQKAKDAEVAKQMPKVIERITSEIIKPGEVKFSERDFSEQVDEVFAGTFERGNAVYVGKTPDILQQVGLNGKLPMLTTAKHILNATKPKDSWRHQHGLTEAQVKSLPEKIAAPVMVLDSRTNAQSVIVVTDMLDPDGSPVVVTIMADGRGMYNNVEIDTNFVTSYYGRDAFDGFIADNVAADSILYVNRKKATALAAESNTSWFEQLKSYDFDTIVRQTRANVKLSDRDAEATGQYADGVKFSERVTDQETLTFLNGQETITTYKTMQLVDGKLYPPMAARTEGRYEDYSILGHWEQATEHPELITDGNQYKLDKGKGQGSLKAAYNPYMHSSNLVLNDQFSGAYSRPQLVTVECEVPVSELTSGYHAQYAKDSVGWHAWHTGTVAGQLRKARGIERQVFLSRWIKPVRIVPDAEVAGMYKELLGGTDIAVPDNVVTPSLLAELKKAGVKTKVSGKVKFSDRDYLAAVDGGDMETAQRMVDEAARAAGYTIEAYHGTVADFTVFDKGMQGKGIDQYGAGFYFANKRDTARGYGKNVKATYLNIKKPIRIRRTMDGGDLYDVKITQKQAYEILKRHPLMYTEESPLGDFYPEFWEVGAKDWMVRGMAKQYTTIGLLDGDIFRRFPNELHDAIHDVIGYDGVQVYFEDEDKFSVGDPDFFYIAWFDNQMKSSEPVVRDDAGEVIPLSERFNSERNDIRFSERDTDSVSHRDLLASAFEAIAQNDIERGKIAEYQKKVKLLNEQERKLREIRKRLHEISFSPGQRDQAEIRRLREEATKIANRIGIYDKQLLRLEASAPLMAVLEREKKLAYSRASQKWADRVETARTGRNKTEMRHKIKGIVSELNQLLLHGSKDKHVMIGLQRATAEALSAINMDTVAAEERLAKIQAKIDRATDPAEIAKLQQTYARIEEMGMNMTARLTALKNAYEDIKDSGDPLVAGAYQPEIEERIKNLRKMVGDTPLRNMSMEQLEFVYDTYKMVLTTIRNANKAFKNERGETIAVLGNRAMEEIEAVGGKHPLAMKATKGALSFAWSGMKPTYAFKAIGSDTLSEMFSQIRAGEDTWAVDVSEAKAFYQQKAKQYHYDAWDLKKQYSFTSKTGKPFKLTLEQIMSLYAYSKRKQADAHLDKGGFVFDDAIEVVQKKHGIPVKYTVKTADAHNLSRDTLMAICGTLTEEQVKFVDEMQEYLSTTMGGKGNEVSLALYGVKLFKEKFYFPLKSAKQYMFEQNEVAGEVKIKNSGFSKETVQHASNPVILSNFTDVWAAHVNDMAMYHAFVLPLEDFNRVFNYKTPNAANMDTESVKMYLQNAYGRQPEQYIKALLTDLNGGARSDPNAGIINKGIGIFKKSAVFASLSVVIQQPSAIARAAAYIDTKYFVGKPSTKSWEEVKKYAPVAIIKEMGYFDTNMGVSTTEFIKAKSYNGIKAKMAALVTDSQYRDEILSKAPAVADEMAWCQIWEAVKKEVAATKKLKGEELLQAAGKRFTEVIVNTQVYDSVLSRSGMMRSKDTGVKMATAFMAEPTTSLNMITDALIQGKRGNKKFARKAIGSVLASMILNSVLVSFVYAGRDDDEDKTYWEKYVGTLTGELIDSFNPLTMIPFVKDIVSIAQGYDVERSDMAVVTDLYKAWKGLSSSNRTVYRKVEDFAGAVAAIFGLPVKNIMRDARGIYNTVMSFMNGTATTGRGVGEAAREAVTGKERSNADQLYSAMLHDDAEHTARVKARFKDEKAVAYAIRDGLVAHDPRITEAAEARVAGKQTEYLRLAREITGEGHFTQDDVVRAINYVTDKLRKGETTSTSSLSAPDTFKMEDYYNEAMSGDQAEATVVKRQIIAGMVAEGKTEEEAEKNFNNSFKNTAVKAAFLEGDLSVDKAVSVLQKYGGLEEDAARADVQYWAFSQDYPNIPVEDSWFDAYYKHAADENIPIDVFMTYKNDVRGITGEGKKARRMDVIDSLPLTYAQKDALYYSEGWAASTIWEAPWH